MANRVTMNICGEEYTFVAEESASYMQKVGSYVNGKMEELLAGAKVGRTDAAVLTAANIADELFKEREAGEGLEIDGHGVPLSALDLDQAVGRARGEIRRRRIGFGRLRERVGDLSGPDIDEREDLLQRLDKLPGVRRARVEVEEVVVDDRLRLRFDGEEATGRLASEERAHEEFAVDRLAGRLR